MGGPLLSGHPEAAPSSSWVLRRRRSGALPALRVELQSRKLLSCHLDLAPQQGSPPVPFVCCHSFGCVGQEPQGADWHCGLRLCLDKQCTCHMEKWQKKKKKASATPSFVCLSQTVRSYSLCVHWEVSSPGSLTHGVANLVGGRKINK